MKDYLRYIDDYISGQLSPELMEEVRQRLEIDDELQEEYQILRKSREYLKAKSMLEEIKSDPDLAKAEEVAERFYQETERSVVSTKRIRNRLYYLLPITAATIAGLIILIKSFTVTDPNERIFKQHYAPFGKEILELEIVRGEIDRNLHEGIDCYLQQDYSSAIKYFSKSKQHSYYLGLAYLGMDDFSKAKAYLLIYQNKHPDFAGANWYLGLTLIRLNEVDEASKYMQKIIGSDNRYQRDAAKVLRKIGKLITAGRK